MNTKVSQKNVESIFDVIPDTKYFAHILFHTICLQIRFENRYRDDIGSECKISVDTTDCKVTERPAEPRWPGWKSHKFKGAAARYEVGVCIRTGGIVWINGPFPAGHNADVAIFRRFLRDELDDGEYVEADGGYRGDPRLLPLRLLPLRRSYHCQEDRPCTLGLDDEVAVQIYLR